jgi:hypothetical protein
MDRFTEDGWGEYHPVEDAMTYYCDFCGVCHVDEYDYGDDILEE